MVESVSDEDGNQKSLQKAVKECNRSWVQAFNLDKIMSDQHDTGTLDLDDLLVFIEIVTKDA